MSDGWYLIDLDRAETFEFGWDTWILHNHLSASWVGTWLVESAATGDRESWDFAWNDRTMMGNYGLCREAVPVMWDWIRAAPAQRTVTIPTHWSRDMCIAGKAMHLTVCRGIIVQSGTDYAHDICYQRLPKWRQVASTWFYGLEEKWYFNTDEPLPDVRM